MSKNAKKSQYRVTPITTNEIDLPWLCSVARDYKVKMVTLQRSMGAQYQTFSHQVSLLLNHLDEARQIRRILPKNEWVLAQTIKVILSKKVLSYLLLVGAEVNIQTRSMGFGAAHDQYQCHNCYYVIGSQEILNAVKFGPPSGERRVRDHLFHEYNNNHPEIHNLVLQLIKIIMTKENLNLHT